MKHPSREHELITATLAAQRPPDTKRRWLLVTLLLLLLLLIGSSALFLRYLVHPEPLPEILPIPLRVKYMPHYLVSIYGVDQPLGVAVSAQGDRIYVAETGGERLVKMFDRDGNLLGAFAPPRTRPGERSPVFLATDSDGHVFVTDRLQHAVFVYDRDGNYQDSIIGPTLTLSEYVAAHVNENVSFAYNTFESVVYYGRTGGLDQALAAPGPAAWSPLGIAITGAGDMLVTDVGSQRHVVRAFPSELVVAQALRAFDPPSHVFGSSGRGNGQLYFPNAAATDSQGRIFVTDSNNGRVSVWDQQGSFLFHFGQGSGDGALSLPRGAAIDGRDYLHIVDTVGQNVKVYDVSAAQPNFLFVFGVWGLGDGQFNYPNDITLDATGRLYIADRENDRVQVWSY